MELIRLEVGSGGNPRPGYVHLDIDLKAKHLEIHSSTNAIPLMNESVIELLSINMLEHIEWTMVRKTLKEWGRVVTPGGSIKIHVPDIEWLITFFKDSKDDWKKNVGNQPLNAAEDKWEYLNHYVMSTNTAYNMHRSVFTEKMLYGLLTEVGFGRFKRILTEPRWLFIEGIKL
jgi:predicted SAM-dependent methyltransferase